MKNCRINLQQIDFNDDTFRLAPAGEDIIPPELSASIERLGILHPPLLKEKRDDCFQVISGRKRLLALAETGGKSARCLLAGDSLSPANCLALALEDALLSKTLTPVGRAIFFKKILRETNRNRAAKKFLPVMGLPPRPGLIDRFINLLKLETPLLAALHQGELDEKAAGELAALSFDERLVLFEIISLLNLSVSNQRKFIRICRELAARHNTSIRSFLSNDEVDAILNHTGTNRPQKTARLMNWLNDQRFPRLCAAEEEFRRFSKSLKLPKNVRLTHSPCFEKDEITMTITFSGREDLQAKWPLLKEILQPD